MNIALQAANGLYVCAENGGDDRGIVHANRPVIGEWETWDLSRVDGGVTFQSASGRYLSAELGGGGAVHANRVKVGPWEIFVPSNGGFRCCDERHWLCAELGLPDVPLVADRLAQGPWETFTQIHLDQPAVSPVTRAPLPAFPPGTYDRTFPLLPPAPDVLTYRGNFCGIRVPGIPGVPGGRNFTVPGGDTSLVMACHLDRYPEEWQRAYLARYASYGYTHVQQSIGHSVGAGRSIEQFVQTQKLIQSYGLFADVWFLGGGRGESDAFTTRDQDAAFWAPKLDPWIDALLANHAIDTACVGWQLDGFNAVGRPIQSIIDYLADRLGPHNIPIGTHWINEAGGWWDPKEPGYGGSDARFVWWRAQRNKVLLFHHQGDVRMPIPLYQAKLADTLNPFGDGRMGRSGLFGDRPFGLVVFECSAQNQFDGTCSEAEGDLRSYLLMCTHAASRPVGYGNGARASAGGFA